jgi:MFS family permease
MFFRRAFLPFAVGYFLSQWFRSVNAVVSADLIRELSLDAWTVGLLTSSYFLAFSIGQIPVGVALDRFGPRRTESLLLLFAAAGALVFATSDGALGLMLGRGLIGLGVSACLMASFHAFMLWAPSARVPFLNGAVMAVGALGALSATAPVEWALSFVTWRELFAALAVVTLGVALFLYLQAMDPEAHRTASLREVSRGLGQVFTSRIFWSVAPLSITHQGTYLAVQSLWAGPWLRDVAGLPRADVANHLFTLALSMAVGFLGIGYVAERMGRRGIRPEAVWTGCALAFQAAQGAIAFELVPAPRALWVVFGLFGASGMLSYVILTRRFPIEIAGRVNACLNVLVFASAFGIQAAIGAVINWWSPAGSFSTGGYRVAFGSALALQVLALVWFRARFRRTETSVREAFSHPRSPDGLRKPRRRALRRSGISRPRGSIPRARTSPSR